MNYTVSNIGFLNDAFEKVYIITGNHDLFYREKREIHSLVMGKNFENVVLVDEPVIDGDVAIVPWLIEDEWKKVKKIKTKYMFGHFEIPGFKMNAQIEMPDHGAINKRHFEHQDLVFSGHFHKRQNDGHIHYIGNPFGHNFADAWDFNRGAMFLEWDKEPEYVNYPHGPRYITCYLSELLDNTEDYLKPKTYVRVTLDSNISYEEINFLRETLIENYEIRDLKLIYDRTVEEDIEFEGEITFQTVDQIVTEQLSNLDLGTYDRKKLVEIYNNL
jgi:DNA repair exonuclease SbcCD nuclease subunit